LLTFSHKNILFCIIAAAVLMAISSAAAFSIQAEAAGELSQARLEELERIEQTLTGDTYAHSDDRRVERLEQRIYGVSRDGDLEGRIRSLADYVLPDGSSPSLGYLISYLEQVEFGQPREGPLLERLEYISKEGHEGEGDPAGEGAAVPTLHRLFQELSENNPLEGAEAEEVSLEQGQSFTVRLERSADSGSVQTGRMIDFTVEEDFVVDDVLVLPAGTAGRMRVAGRESAGWLGSDGELKLEDHSLESLDGQRLRFSPAPPPEPEGVLDTSLDFISRHRSRFLAAGAGVAGSLILEHPGGMIFSFAVPGREESYSQGEVIELQIDRTAEVFGIPLDEEE